MKKMILAIAMVGFLNAADHDLYDNSISVNVGYGSMMTSDGSYSGLSYGFQFNRNVNIPESLWSVDAIQFAINYAKLNTKKRESVLRLGANAIWYLDDMSVWTPFVKGGLGVQFINGTENISGGNYFYGTLGAGVEYQLRGDTSVIGEVVDHISFSGENSLRLSAGLKYSFGQEY